MASVHVTTGDAPIFDRRRVERLLEQRRGTTYAPPLCRAADALLSIGPDGACHACPHAKTSVGNVRSSSIERIRNDVPLRQLRAALASDALPQPHCETCIDALTRDRDIHAPLVRDMATVSVAADGHLASLRWQVGSESRPADVAAILAAAADVEELVLDLTHLDSEDALSNGLVTDLLARLPAKSPKLAIVANRLTDRDTDRMAPHALSRIELLHGDGFAQSLAVAGQLRSKHAAALTVRLILAADNWFEMLPAARATASAGGNILFRLAPANRPAPLAAVGLSDLQTLHNELGTWWQHLGSDARPASVGRDEFALVLDEFRCLLEDIAEKHVWTDPQRAIEGDGARFGLPTLDHELLADANSPIDLIKSLLWTTHSPSVVTWVRHLARQPGAGDAALTRPWLRILYQKIAADDPDAVVWTMLRDLYADGEQRQQLRADEVHLAAGVGLQDLSKSLRERLGLDASRHRQAPFGFAPQPPPATTETPRVTVLVPSYKHEQFVDDAIRSVLAQSLSAFELLIIDDRSPDETVDRALATSDPRVRVAVNATNVGLGNSVLGVLPSIAPPYVALLNSDDVFHPDRLAECIAALDADPECQLVSTGFSLIDSAGAALLRDNVSPLLDTQRVADLVHWFEQRTPDCSDPQTLFRQLLEWNFLATSSNIVCRTDFLRSQESSLRSLKYCLDWQLFLAAAMRRSLRHLPKPLLGYRLHASNTVWFQEGQRWSYTLEVNRVAAQSLRDWLAPDASGQIQLRDAVVAALGHVRRNRELNGYGLWLHSLVDPLALARVSILDPTVRGEVESLAKDMAKAQRALDVAGSLGERAQELLGEIWRIPQLQVISVLHDIHRSRAREAQGAKQWADRRIDELTRELSDAWQSHNAVQINLNTATDRLHSSLRELGHLMARFEAETRLRNETDTRLRDVQGANEDLHRQIQGVTEEIAQQRETLREQTETAANSNRIVAELRAELAAVGAASDAAHARATGLEAKVAAAAEDLVALRKARADLEGELGQLRASREWRYGNFFWNKLPLTSSTSRRLKKLYNRTKDIKTRSKMFLRRLLDWRRRQTRQTAIVAATARFPNYSHTFVYQELVSMREMGMDPTLFYWIQEDPGILSEAYGYLLQNSLLLKSTWDVHSKDMAWWKERCPDKVRSLTEKVAAAGGMSIEELEKTYVWMQAFTFARIAEQSRPDYIHTYFFYEQSLFGLVTAHLLDLPRGVSAYADHMLSDWPLKLVPLHLEMADVVVATSSRIKRELIEIARGRFADKIVVKPNGVDGSVFAAQPRSEKVDGWFDIVSVSRIEPKKGLLTLAEAAKILKDAGARVRFRIVGTVDKDTATSVGYDERLRARIAQLDIADRIVFEGLKRQQDLLPIHAQCHAFVAPYVETESGDKDGIPTALLEGIAVGLPALVTDAGSILEVVRDNVDGIVFKQHDASGLAAAVQRLMSNPKLRLQMGRSARQRFEAEFSTEVTERRLHDRIKQALRTRR